ncbi:MAG: hypothetical protein U0Q15_11350 [Kineosporiaceae bacterium]
MWGKKIAAEVGRPWLDPGLDAVVADVEPALRPYEQVDPDRLDAASAVVAPAVDRLVEAVAGLRGEPDRQVALVRALSDLLAPAADHLLRRAEGVGPDHAADEADLRAMAAQGLLAVAWQIRSGALARDVAAHRWVPFHDVVARADAQCVRALELTPGHPLAATTRLTAALGSGDLDSAGWQARFEAATATAPTLFAAHDSMLYALTPKWYGSVEAMFGFARRVAREAPEGEPVAAMLPLAHVYHWEAGVLGGESPAKGLAVLKDGLPELLAARGRWLAGRSPAEAGRAHVAGLDANHLFGWAFHIVDKDLAREHFSVGLGRVARMPWGLFGDPAAAYGDVMKRLKVKTAS